MNYDPIDHDFERGLENRRRILGDPWVDRSLAGATGFNAEFQNLITRFAWNEIWGRPGLDAKSRRVIVLATTMALARWEEFELHARAALLGGDDTRLTADELKEVLMQGAIYAGVPAANTAFAMAGRVLREVGPSIGYHVEPSEPVAAWHPGTGREGHTDCKPRLHYSVRMPRSGRAPRHTIVLAHALGCDLTMWDRMTDTLAIDCRVICYDQRGHGASDSPAGPYTMAALADDAARLLRELDTGPVVWVGISMGAMVGQELALRHPALVSALVLANTSSCYPEAARAMWQARIEAVATGGMEAIAEAVIQRYFSQLFRAAQPATVARFRRRLLTTDRDGYIACCAAVCDVDTTGRLAHIGVPTLVIAGALDTGTPPLMAEAIANGVAGARLVVLSEASHLSAIEVPKAFEAELLPFISAL
ncbi:MAG: hypothetical protein NVSMB6_22030 [Burkholderiaceae bacterium]